MGPDHWPQRPPSAPWSAEGSQAPALRFGGWLDQFWQATSGLLH